MNVSANKFRQLVIIILILENIRYSRHNLIKQVAEINLCFYKYSSDLIILSGEDIKKNGKRFSVYDDIKKKLIAKGIPEKEIAFIHDAGDSETKKAQMFAKVRSGDIRVLIGSTSKMGAGTNVQNKLIASHDLDCPWKPADMTQRAGCMVR